MKDMKTTQYLVIIVFALFVASCGTPKVVMNYKADAEQAEQAGNFNEAFTAWNNYITQMQSRGEDIDGNIFGKAAKTAFKAEKYGESLKWFEQAGYKGFSDAEMYLMLSELFKSIDNLSKELETLEYYADNFNASNTNVNKRLFSIYYTIDEHEKALKVWDRIPTDSINSEKLLENYFIINKKADNKDIADKVSLDLLKMNPENVYALEWNAMKYYWLAENKYQREMKKYEQNKTGLQYVLLKKELNQVTANFRKSLQYFQKLWELNPGKKYAPYMANIHTRFDEDQKSAYYRQFLEE
jgi:tetratricopeptide (TPR) repeat protein